MGLGTPPRTGASQPPGGLEGIWSRPRWLCTHTRVCTILSLSHKALEGVGRERETMSTSCWQLDLSLETAVASVCMQVCSSGKSCGPCGPVPERYTCACAAISLGSHRHMPCSLGALGNKDDPGTLLPFLGSLLGAQALRSGSILEGDMWRTWG